MSTQTQSAHILLRSGEARKVGQRSTGTIRYDIVSDSERTKVFIRITGNDGGGYFSRELVDFDKAIDGIASYKDGSPFPSKIFAPAFVGKSSNNAGFLAAVLRGEQLLDAAPGSDFQHVVSGEWADWKSDALKLEGTPIEEPKSSDAPLADNTNKALPKRSKSKKGHTQETTE
ncbi:hypothetical protein HT749_31955 [Burkholderia cepacia]|uniref:hypothetical protein n=1 Tax=Burkholderia cepacia complex TaxID=87882 RepID=UPI00157B7F05|nr:MULTISPECIES: hypothetical protein [Burkholderia cepacia complex]MBR8218294.1 hypothetical protein [Burkholderia vietnamiensis]NTX48006.1 hypothetical protein [Burkholderia cepacia]